MQGLMEDCACAPEPVCYMIFPKTCCILVFNQDGHCISTAYLHPCATLLRQCPFTESWAWVEAAKLMRVPTFYLSSQLPYPPGPASSSLGTRQPGWPKPNSILTQPQAINPPQFFHPCPANLPGKPEQATISYFLLSDGHLNTNSAS